MKFQIDHDLHIHSQLSSCSNHPEQTTENILNYAKANGFKHICLTDHFWDADVPGASDWYRPQNYAHISKALPLPKADGIRFDFGCEADFDKNLNLTATKKTIDKLDFVIVATSHLHMAGYTIDKDIKQVADRARVYMQHNHALLDMDLPFCKMGLAHFTCSLLSWDGIGTNDELLYSVTDSEYAEFFERVAASGMGVELNMSAAEAQNEANLRIYRIARERGCKFYLGSDAHTPAELSRAMTNFHAIVDALDLTEDDKHPFITG